MRILLVNHEFTITGASTVFWRLARHLKARGHELGLYPCNPEDGPMKPRFEALGIAILGQAVVAEYDLVIANTVCAGGVVIQAGSFTPVIWFLHETEIGLQIILQTPALAEAFRTAAAVVYQTSHQAEMYRSFTYQLDPRKFAVIPNGIEPVPEHLPSVTEKGRALRIVQVGSVEPRKRPGDLIRAVVRSGIDADCVICGKFFVLDEEAQALVDARPGQFHFTGEVEPDEALAWMRSGDIYALVSASESQPVSVLEAAAMGKALLLTSLPSYAGAYTHGRNCLMAPAGHVELLAHSLNILAASAGLRAELGQAARRTARDYTHETFCRRFDELIAGVTG